MYGIYMATNKYPGTCKCGTKVATGAGSVTRVGGKWVTTCATHSARPTFTPAPVHACRDFDDDDAYDRMKDAACEAGTWGSRNHGRRW